MLFRSIYGETDYKVTKKGHINKMVSLTNTLELLGLKKTSVDKLYGLGNKDGRLTSIDVKKGILNNIKKDVTKSSKPHEYQYLSIKDENESIKLFEFFSNTTNVEWSRMEFDKGNSDYIISTSHESGADSGAPDIIMQTTEFGIISKHDHNHPLGSQPSGFDTKNMSGDREFAHWLRNYNPEVKLRVYDSNEDKYTKYNYIKIDGSDLYNKSKGNNHNKNKPLN